MTGVNSPTGDTTGPARGVNTPGEWKCEYLAVHLMADVWADVNVQIEVSPFVRKFLRDRAICVRVVFVDGASCGIAAAAVHFPGGCQ